MLCRLRLKYRKILIIIQEYVVCGLNNKVKAKKRVVGLLEEKRAECFYHFTSCATKIEEETTLGRRLNETATQAKLAKQALTTTLDFTLPELT
jgi:hypothetical protein